MTRDAFGIFDDISEIKGIGDKKAGVLRNMGISSVKDLLDHYPVRYRDKRKVTPSNVLREGVDQLACGMLISKRQRRFGGSRVMVECSFRDEGGVFSAVYFNMPYMMKNLEEGSSYCLFGKIRYRNGAKVFTNPETTAEGSTKDIRGILPVYRCKRGVTNNDFIKWNRTVLDTLESDSDWLDKRFVDKRKLCSDSAAYQNIHFPKDEKWYGVARYRLIYEQLLAYRTAILLNSSARQDDSDASVDPADADVFIDALPFELTTGQKEAAADILKDLTDRKPMNRLIQGDVGCGKTVVAEIAIYRVVKAGKQAAMMVPTEILARQHFKNMSALFAGYGFRTALLTSGMKAAERREIIAGIESGDVDIVIGTHALIQSDVMFSDLALVITDEQHRFGVNQRKTLVQKGRGINVLVMSATPIPRTLASTVFGDMDFSIISSKPASRKEIITRSVGEDGREKAYRTLAEELSKGHKGYVVAPTIEENEDNPLNSAQKLFEEMKKRFSAYNVAWIHGKIEKSEKDRIMQDFADGKIDLLVSTVVIEVGIDIPDATIMVIENSERFGLAQLHQLRGRVGRSELQSYCYLICYSRSETALERMDAMVKYPDGFDISEEDFRLRGPGDIMGTMQHGSFKNYIFDLFKYTDILDAAGEDAAEITADPGTTDMDRLMGMIDDFYAGDNSDII
jgi:ATP-dependent DNA helicase RecG